MKLDYSKLLTKERTIFRNKLSDLDRRRRAWSTVSHQVESYLLHVKEHFDEDGFFDNLYVSRTTNARQLDPLLRRTNQNFVSLFFGNHPTGINQITRDPTSGRTSHNNGIERGGCLQFSQGPSGDIVVFIAACASDLVEHSDPQIFYKVYREPEKVTERQVYAAVRTFFWYVRYSSFMSLPTFWDVIFISWYQFKTWLHRLEWATIIYVLAALATVLTLVVTIYFALHPTPIPASK